MLKKIPYCKIHISQIPDYLHRVSIKFVTTLTCYYPAICYYTTFPTFVTNLPSNWH